MLVILVPLESPFHGLFKNHSFQFLFPAIAINKSHSNVLKTTIPKKNELGTKYIAP